MILGRQKIINPLGHKTILGPSAQGWNESRSTLIYLKKNYISISSSQYFNSNNEFELSTMYYLDSMLFVFNSQ